MFRSAYPSDASILPLNARKDFSRSFNDDDVQLNFGESDKDDLIMPPYSHRSRSRSASARGGLMRWFIYFNMLIVGLFFLYYRNLWIYDIALSPLSSISPTREVAEGTLTAATGEGGEGGPAAPAAQTAQTAQTAQNLPNSAQYQQRTDLNKVQQIEEVIFFPDEHNEKSNEKKNPFLLDIDDDLPGAYVAEDEETEKDDNDGEKEEIYIDMEQNHKGLIDPLELEDNDELAAIFETDAISKENTAAVMDAIPKAEKEAAETKGKEEKQDNIQAKETVKRMIEKSPTPKHERDKAPTNGVAETPKDQSTETIQNNESSKEKTVTDKGSGNRHEEKEPSVATNEEQQTELHEANGQVMDENERIHDSIEEKPQEDVSKELSETHEQSTNPKENVPTEAHLEKEKPPILLEESPKEAPKEALTEAPKETPKEAPKETPKEPPKETPKEPPSKAQTENHEEKNQSISPPNQHVTDRKPFISHVMNTKDEVAALTSKKHTSKPKKSQSQSENPYQNPNLFPPISFSSGTSLSKRPERPEQEKVAAALNEPIINIFDWEPPQEKVPTQLVREWKTAVQKRHHFIEQFDKGGEPLAHFIKQQKEELQALKNQLFPEFSSVQTY